MTNASAATFPLSAPSSVEFGTVTVGQAASSTLTLVNQTSSAVQISQLKITGNTFAIAGQNTLPITIGPNGGSYALTLQFTPTGEGDSTGQLLVSATSSAGGTVSATSIAPMSSSFLPEASSNTPNSNSQKIKLHGKGKGRTNSGTVAPSSLSCSQGSITGAGTDACTVALSAAAGTGGLVVNLSSSNSAVTVPSSVTVPAGATNASFTATVSAVTTAQTATLTASANNVSQTYAINLGAYVPALTLSTTSLDFGSETVNTTTTQPVTLTSSGTAPLTISADTVTGTGFSVSGISLPMTLNPGQAAKLSVSFDPTSTGPETGALTLTDNASPSTATVSLSGTGQSTAGVLSALKCASNSVTGSTSDACTASLSAPAGSAGLAVSLSSNNSAVTVPGSVTVAAGATSASFTATVSAVTTAQTATLTASAGSVTVTYSLQLNAATVTLTLSTTSVPFGDVTVNTTATQSVSLTSSGTSQLTVNSASVTGAGFSISGLTFPLTLNPGQSAMLDIAFDPTVTGTATGSVTISTNASSGGTATISLSGNGVAASYQVDLTWNPPTNSTDPVAGYNVYRATGTSSSYQLMNSSVDPQAAYSDTTVQTGTSYNYYVVSVDSQGNQSTPSNIFTVTIP